MITQKQKDELITRAVEHREADRLIQSYGYFEPMGSDQAEEYNRPGMNGEKTDWKFGDWAGCAIGCLASEVLSQEEYRAKHEDGSLWMLDQDSAMDVLDTEFGVPRPLSRMAENIFEYLPKEDAVNWPEQFARALPVDRDLDAWELIDYRERSDSYQDMQRAVTLDQRKALSALARNDLLAWLTGDTDRSEVAA